MVGKDAAECRGKQVSAQVHSARGSFMINRDVLATFPCRVRRRGQILAASACYMSQHLRNLNRCRSLSDYRRSNTGAVGVSRLSDI